MCPFSLQRTIYYAGKRDTKMKNKRKYLGPQLNTETHKWCNKCSNLLERKNFYKSKSKSDGLHSECKECAKSRERVKDYEILGFKYNSETHKWCSKCETLKLRTPEYFFRNKRNKDGLTGYCKVCTTQVKKDRIAKDPDYYRKRRQRNLKKQREYDREWFKNARKDESFRLRGVVSKAILRTLKQSGGSKKSISCFNYLPYTPQELKEHLENQFDDKMSWENYGNSKGCWSVDHITPQSKLPYDSYDHPNFMKCWSLENLRPLDHIENIKKSNKIIDLD